MTIMQFNASYLVNEDRILFRFNTQDQAEYRLWFTRRVTLFILAATEHLIIKRLEKTHSLDAVKALAEFKKQSILDASKDQSDAAKAFNSGAKFPIGADALLVMDVSCSLINQSEKLAYIPIKEEGEINDAISIDFLLPGGGNLNLKLPENLLQSVRILLDQLSQNAGWGEAVLQEKSVNKDEKNIDLKLSKNISIH